MSLHLDSAAVHLPTHPASAPAATEFNPYLHGVHAPTYDELTLDSLEVVGEIPADLNGVYVRNGPNPQHEPRGRYHWFDGDGMVHAVHFADGKASYRNRWVRTDGFQRERDAGDVMWSGIMEPFSENPPGEPEKDTANTDLVFHNDKLLALWYRAGKPYAMDPVTLETVGTEDFGGTLRSEVSAHAKVDERTGEMLFFDYGLKPPYMRYGVVDRTGVVTHFVPIDLPGPRLPHDMACTENHSILMDLPLINDPRAARQGRFKLFFDRDMQSRFGVIPRYGGAEDIRWFSADPCFIYHSINAWEEGEEIVMDTCRVIQPEPAGDSASRPPGPLAQMLTYLRMDAHIHRYRFNLRTGQTTEGPVDDENSEFPSINNWMLGHKSRYAYNMHISNEKSLLFDGLTKYDLGDGSSETHWYGEGRWGSEAPFAPRAGVAAGTTAEDDGYLVSYVYDENAGHSEVQVLDAADVAAGPLCTVKIPVRVPIGFHATWVPGDKLPGGSAQA
jgi:carotenoid cleavage dioxygenase-like enzyme